MDRARNHWVIAPPDRNAQRSQRIGAAASGNRDAPRDGPQKPVSAVVRIRWAKTRVAHVIASH
jgi:hypothetical protein